MGLSKLSEKCQKCKRKDNCDNKRMEVCGYIEPIPKFAQSGFPMPENLFFCRGDSGPELIGNLSNKYSHGNEKVLEAIADGVRKGIEDVVKNVNGITISIEGLSRVNQ
jgi:hypothetical protein